MGPARVVAILDARAPSWGRWRTVHIEYVLWGVALTALTLLGWPWARLVFGGLPSRGALLAAPVGAFLYHYLAWLGLFSGRLPNGRGYAWLMLAVFALLSAALVWYQHRRPHASERRRGLWLGGLVVLLLVFALGVGLRWLNPEINGTEKPMDFALLNAVIHSSSFPPPDPWFAGEPINYYYLGYSMGAGLVHLSGVAPAVGFNLFLATLLALSVLSVAAAAYDLASLLGLSPGRARLAAAASSVLGIIAGNLAVAEGLLGDRFRDHVGFWDGIGWNASRVIQQQGPSGLTDFTINEFPSFSFILGDLHPHVMALPFATLTVSLALQWIVSWSRPGQVGGQVAWTRSALTGLFVGGLYGFNAWDLPGAAGAVLGGALLAHLSASGRRRWPKFAMHVAVAGGVAVVAWLPFSLTFAPIGNAIGVVNVRTQIADFLIVFGLLGVLAAGAIWALLWNEGRRGRVIWAAAAVGAAVLVGLNGGEVAGALAVAVALALYVGTRPGATPGRVSLAWLLVVAAGLLFMVEIVHVRDFFGGAYERMNTVFKIHYQAWAILAVVAGPALYLTLQRLRSGSGVGAAGVRAVYVSVVAALALVALAYPPIATVTKAAASPASGSLDGLAFVRQRGSPDLAAAEWLARQAAPGSRVLEAPGRPYSGDSRISEWSGVPTVIGWDQHETLWRGADPRIAARKADVDRVYSTPTPAEALEILRRYHVTQVVFGEVEQARYGAAASERLASFLTPVFAVPGVQIFTVPEPS